MGSFTGETLTLKILLDTNVILDVAQQIQPYYDESDQVLSLVEQGQLEGYISASSFSDIYYISRKTQGRDWSLRFLQKLVSFCKIATVDEAAISMALAANFRDFEDAIQYSVAVINQLDAIVTRNTQDFTNVTLPILTPTQLIEELGI